MISQVNQSKVHTLFLTLTNGQPSRVPKILKKVRKFNLVLDAIKASKSTMKEKNQSSLILKLSELKQV